MGDPWGQQPGEKPEDYEAFLLYRDMGKRSMARLKEMTNLPPGRVTRISRRFSWIYRAQAYDRWLKEIGKPSKPLSADERAPGSPGGLQMAKADYLKHTINVMRVFLNRFEVIGNMPMTKQITKKVETCYCGRKHEVEIHVFPVEVDPAELTRMGKMLLETSQKAYEMSEAESSAGLSDKELEDLCRTHNILKTDGSADADALRMEMRAVRAFKDAAA